MHLVRDLLDQPLVDARGRRLGTVDSVVLAVPSAGPPRVVALEAGALTLADRLHPALGRWLTALAHRAGVTLEPLRVPWATVRETGRTVTVDAERLDALALERWLARRLVRRVPGG